MRIPFFIILLISILSLAVHYSLTERHNVQSQALAETLSKIDGDPSSPSHYLMLPLTTNK